MGPAHGHAAGPGYPEGNVHVVTDLEGRCDALNDLVHAGVLRRLDDELEFVDPGDGLYFAGDVCDRGPWSIRLVDMLLSLRRRHPGRVAWCHGNLDLKNLALLRDLPRLEQGLPDFDAWRGDRADTLDGRLDYWLGRQGAARAFGFHQCELTQIHGRAVSREEAAEDYMARLRPGGAMFEFLRHGQIAIVHGNVLIDHGGVSASNIGFVPGATTRMADARAWIDALNAYARDQIARVERAVLAGDCAFPDAFIRYADAIWDPAARAGSGALFMNDISLVYPFRQREHGNFRVPDEPAIRYLHDAGIDTEIVGHSPFGDVPGPLRAGGFLRLMADTSHRRDGVHSTITIDRQGALRVRASTAAGATIAYRTSAASTSPIGHVTREDGYTVVGRGRVDGRTHFLLTKYFDGYNIRDRWVDRAHLAAMRPEAAVAACEADEPRRHHELLVAELRRKGKRILDLDAVEALIGHRTPIVVSGFSHFGHAPFAESRVDAEAQALVSQLAPPGQEILITGGTDVGFERAVHRAARNSGHDVVGFIQRGALAGEIDLVDDLSFAGAYRDWSAPLLAALSFAAARGGCAVFVGGGPTVGAGIEHARRLGMAHYLIARAPGIEGDGGASAQAADRLAGPERAQCVLQTLRALAAARRARGVAPAGQPPRGLTLDVANDIDAHHLYRDGDTGSEQPEAK